jgi:hypothetical protein
MRTKREGSSFQKMSSDRKLESVFLFVTGKRTGFDIRRIQKTV